MSQIIITLHGIRTRGTWQKQVAPILARNGFTPYLLDYGYFSALKFVLPWARNRKLRWLRDTISDICEKERVSRVSIIAHSFGSYLVAKLVESNPSFLFDKIILTGSIVDANFDWNSYIEKGRVNLVRNDFGRLDNWPAIASNVVPGAGPSGRQGFKNSSKNERLINYDFKLHGHSSSFHINHYKEFWVPTLKKSALSKQDGLEIQKKMNLIVQQAANILHMQKTDLRANIFTEEDRKYLSMPPDLHYNMDDEKEKGVRIKIGTGCAGITFQRGVPTVAIKGENSWGRHGLTDEALAKLHPDLLWVVGMPIRDPETGVLLGTFNLDGLRITKELYELYDLSFDLYDDIYELGKLMREIL